MNVLFLTMLKVTSIENRGIYTDLYREFVKNGHNIYIVSPSERREKHKHKHKIIKEQNTTILRVNTLNLQKTSLLEKGVGQLLFEYQFLKAIKLNFSNIKFDLVVYSTPPITFEKVISFIKKRDKAYSYLLLKDIFPQNAVDLGMIKKNGLLHNFFLRKEKKLYNVSDKIGCMSPANMNYVLKHNSYISKDKVEVNPNSIEPIDYKITLKIKEGVREYYNLPLFKKIFVYGGNLGKPQGIDFLLKIIEKCTHEDAYFLIVGSGTEYEKVNNWFKKKIPVNAKLIKGLPKVEYDKLLSCCDVGMIFLHKHFTIPNFPSRLLSYLEMKMPIFTATDNSTDIGGIVEKNNCGFSVETGKINDALANIKKLCNNDDEFEQMKRSSRNLLEKEYEVKYSYNYIINSIKNNV